ncbi:transcriptional regulator NrdR [bacterium]|jgi:transcriptional repressor NrdR|nr:transcriptional regulator NrdR [bacterium]
MKCPYCKHPDSRVVDSRVSGEGFTIRRRRECPNCQVRFTTYEQVAETTVMVVKKDKSREPFDRGKIRAGIVTACFKRPISPEQIDSLIADVEADVLGQGDAEIASPAIGELVMEKLKTLDQVAYVRFASVYREFQDVSDFDAEIRPMLSAQQAAE